MRPHPVRLILGVPIIAITLSEVSKHVTTLIKSREKKTFYYVNAHCLNIAGKDKEYRTILQNASLVYSGGFGPVLASRILARSLPERLPTPDFIYDVLKVAQEKGWSIYFLGGEQLVVEKTAKNLKKQFPKLSIAGYHHGFFLQNKEVITKINRVCLLYTSPSPRD